jgi:hypothetical protein
MSPGPNLSKPDQTRPNWSKKDLPLNEQKSEPAHFLMRSSPIGSACQSPNQLWCPFDRTQVWEPFLHHFLHFSGNRPLQINHLRKKTAPSSVSRLRWLPISSLLVGDKVDREEGLKREISALAGRWSGHQEEAPLLFGPSRRARRFPPNRHGWPFQGRS